MIEAAEDLQTEEEEHPSIHDALEAAINDHETDDPAPQEAAGTEEPLQPAGEGERKRDEKGRFAAESGEEPPKEGVQPQEGDPAAAAAPDGDPPAEPGLAAPQSWRPGAREHWGALPPEVQQEVAKRERDMMVALERTADDRKTAQAFQQVYAPYEAMIRGEGSDPIRAIDTLFQTAYQLRTAQPAQKAQLVAGIIRDYNIDVGALDAVLSGQMPMAQPGMPQQMPQQAPMGDPRVDQLMAALQNMGQQNQQAKDAAAHAEVTEFAKTHEFLNDVRDQMADLIEMSANRGVDLSMEEAYNQACRLHPDVSKVVEQRERAKAASEAQQRGKSARRAASSVSGAPAGAPPARSGPPTLREALSDAFDAGE
jgi:hypothetical protein